MTGFRGWRCLAGYVTLGSLAVFTLLAATLATPAFVDASVHMRSAAAGQQDTTKKSDWFERLKDRIRRAREQLKARMQQSQNNKSTSTPATESVTETGFGTISTMRKVDRTGSSGRLLDRGQASFYGKKWNGRKTANGEIFNHRKLTAAHKTLPFGTYVRVARRDDGRAVVVRINDRGPFKKGRVIDLSTAGAEWLGMLDEGVIDVTVEQASLPDFLRQFQR